MSLWEWSFGLTHAVLWWFMMLRSLQLNRRYGSSSVFMFSFYSNLHMVQIRLQHDIQLNKLDLSLRYSFGWMGYWKPDGKITARPVLSSPSALRVVAEREGRVMERQPGMSRETTDSERSVLFAQVCICVCVSASSTLPAREWLWDWNVVPVRAFFFFFFFFKSETHWHFKHTGDISVAALLCSHFTTKLRSQTSPKLFSLFQMFPPIFFIKNHDFHWNWQMESLWI